MNDPICAVCGESKSINLLMFDYGVCLKEYKLKKAEEATQIHIADLSIENNRLRSRLKDLANEYDRYKTGAIVSNWIAMMAGVLIGGIMTFLIYK